MDDAHLSNIHEMFWKEDLNTRMAWIRQIIENKEPKYLQNDAKNIRNRTVTRVYYLPSASMDRIRVCQGLFLATLGYTCNKVVRVAMQKSAKG